MVTQRPDQVCGVHFFNPAHDDVAGRGDPPDHRQRRDHRHRAWPSPPRAARTPSRSQDRAGFIVNALLFPYLNNAVRMWEHGTASMEAIDTAMKGGCNFPMGPFALLDLVGLDTSLAILDALYAEFRDPNYAAVPTLRRMVAAGHLGRKTKRGFYTLLTSSGVLVSGRNLFAGRTHMDERGRQRGRRSGADRGRVRHGSPGRR